MAVLGQELDFSPHYHGPGDTLAHLDVGYLRDMARAFAATVAHLALRTATPTISIDSVVVAEGDSGKRDAIFTVSVAPASSEEVLVDFHTEDETAVVESDYLAAAGTLTFAPGEATQVVRVPILGDSEVEDDETVHVRLEAPSGAVLGDGWGSGTILAETPTRPALSIDSIAILEGNAGQRDAVFTVSLTSPSAGTIAVDFRTEDGTAMAGQDYLAVSGTVALAPLATTQTIRVPIVGDEEAEDAETFRVLLENPAGADLPEGWRSGTGTIRADEYEVSAAAVGVDEGHAGLAEARVLIRVRPPDPASVPHPQALRVDYRTEDGTATAGFDYQAAEGSLTIGPPGWSEVVALSVVGETLKEPDETFRLLLSAPVGVVATPAVTATILDDDRLATVTFAAANFTASEAEAAGTLIVTRGGDTDLAASVAYATRALTAGAGRDYVSTSGTLTFAAGASQAAIEVPLLDDDQVEAHERLAVTLSSPGRQTSLAEPSTATLTILDDELPQVAWGGIGYAVREGTCAVVLDVRVAGPLLRPVTVAYSATPESARAGADFTPVVGSVTLNRGRVAQVRIPIVDDALAEGGETFRVTLHDAREARLGSRAVAVVTIIDDDHVVPPAPRRPRRGR